MTRKPRSRVRILTYRTWAIKPHAHHKTHLHTMKVVRILIPRFSLLPVERPRLGLVMSPPESGRLQTNGAFGNVVEKNR